MPPQVKGVTGVHQVAPMQLIQGDEVLTPEVRLQAVRDAHHRQDEGPYPQPAATRQRGHSKMVAGISPEDLLKTIRNKPTGYSH